MSDRRHDGEISTDLPNLIRPIRIFLLDLMKGISDADLEKLKIFSQNVDEIDEIEKPLDFFKAMLRTGQLSEAKAKLSWLAEVFTLIDRPDLSEKVTSFSATASTEWIKPKLREDDLNRYISIMRRKNEKVQLSKRADEALNYEALDVDSPIDKLPEETRLKSEKETNDSTFDDSEMSVSSVENIASGETFEMPIVGRKYDDLIVIAGAAEFSYLEKFRMQQLLPKSQKSSVVLYEYQKELARPGLEGRNCIICAPTGSGKTLTAGYICQERRRRARESGKTFKALFIVCIRNLIQQQRDALSRLITRDETGKEIVGGIGETSLLSEYMSNYDVTVLTAQILINCLTNKEVKLSDVDMLIMDECHHTTMSHPYNRIMLSYLESKNERRGDRLPQIIGLTASLGVGSSSNDDDALRHYIRLCASLDCTSVTHVKENVDELLKYSPRPKKDQIIPVDPRQPDVFSRSVIRMMTEVEDMMTFPLPQPPRHPQGTQQYENWVVLQKMEAERTGLQDVIRGTEALRQLNISLVLYDELRGKDAKRQLDEYFDKNFVTDEPSEISSEIYRLYREISSQLESCVREEKIADNLKLDMLCKLLYELYRTNSDARGILLTKTRYGVDALVNFIKEIAQLKSAVYPAKLVGQGRKEGTMTDVEQENTLRLFRLGRDDPNGYNLLVATDVAQEGLDMPKCNFVIRYNFVSNEIGSVQSRGRARAPNSECYLIVNRDSINEKKEYENLEKEHLMMQALIDIDKIPDDKLQKEIHVAQGHLWLEHQRKLLEKRFVSQSLDPGKVSIHCKGCQTVLCSALDMRIKLQNYICIADDLKDKIYIVKSNKTNDYRYDIHIGVTYCKNLSCKKKIGPQIKYKQGLRAIGFAFSKEGVMWKYDGEDEYRHIKQWSKVPFEIKKED